MVQLVVATVSAVIAAGSFSIAIAQYVLAKQKSATDRERLAAISERLRTAVATAESAVEVSDLIVQRTKEEDTTLAEVRNIARAARGMLAVHRNSLYEQLKSTERQAASINDNRRLFSSAATRGGDDGDPRLGAD